jgi:hypothetical protein
MGMDVPDRVHISPLGYEYDRVLEPAVEAKADRVYLLEHSESDNEEPEYHTELVEELQETGIAVQSVSCDIFDLYAVLGKVAELITEHITDEVYVNISTGSKISAIGGMIACMVTRESANVTPYYVRAEGYTPDEEKNNEERPVSFGVAAISELPTYPIQGPSREEISILQYIAKEEPISKKQLIRRARQTIDRFKRNAEKRESTLKMIPIWVSTDCWIRIFSIRCLIENVSKLPKSGAPKRLLSQMKDRTHFERSITC